MSFRSDRVAGRSDRRVHQMRLAASHSAIDEQVIVNATGPRPRRGTLRVRTEFELPTMKCRRCSGGSSQRRHGGSVGRQRLGSRGTSRTGWSVESLPRHKTKPAPGRRTRPALRKGLPNMLGQPALKSELGTRIVKDALRLRRVWSDGTTCRSCARLTFVSMRAST